MSTITKQSPLPVTTYHEQVIGKTLYRVTSEYSGKIDFSKAVEDLIVRKILRIECASGGIQS